MDASGLPLEMWWQIALWLPSDDVWRLCQSHQEISGIYEDEGFWRERLRRRYECNESLARYQKETLIPFRDLYLQLKAETLRLIPMIVIKGSQLNKVVISPVDTYGKMACRVEELLKYMRYPADYMWSYTVTFWYASCVRIALKSEQGTIDYPYIQSINVVARSEYFSYKEK